MAPFLGRLGTGGISNNFGFRRVKKAFSTYAQFNDNSIIGSTINLLGQSGTIRTFSVVEDPDGNKSIRFPVTWPSSSYSSTLQNITYSFSMETNDYNILSDIDYIFNGRTIGVYPISGASEMGFDSYSLTFDGRQFFSTSGTKTNQYYKISFNGEMTSNSGFVRYITDNSNNGGNGLIGANGYFYLF